VLIQSG